MGCRMFIVMLNLLYVTVLFAGYDAKVPGIGVVDNPVSEQLLETVAMQAERIEDLERQNIELINRLQEVRSEGPELPPQDCMDILRQNPTARTGLHNIHPSARFGDYEQDRVYCDMVTDGGGWTVIQRRNEGILNFYRDFQSYAEGFGLQNHEFWIGNTMLHKLTSRWNYELRIDMENAEGDKHHITFPSFMVSSEGDGFRLFKSSNTGGDIGNSMLQNRGMQFSTYDHDMDNSPDNCAQKHNGAWWFKNCTDANLNGLYITPGVSSQDSMFWYDLDQHRSLARVEMRIRPNELTPPDSCPTTEPCPTYEPCPTTIPPTTSEPCPTCKPCEPCQPTDCLEIINWNPQAESGEYDIYLNDGEKQVRVYCDMETVGGGWTVFQRRKNGLVDFFRDYDSYRQGFGFVSREFWWGNDNLHLMTSTDNHELWVDLEDFEGDIKYARYSLFRVGPDSDGYRLTVDGFSGTAGDSMNQNNGMMFTTYDKDQDLWNIGNCANNRQGAWWYWSCTWSNLNGRYHDWEEITKNVHWFHFHGRLEPLKFTEMKIRRIVS